MRDLRCEGRGITLLAPSLGGCGFVSPEQISIRALAWHHSPAHSSAKNKRAQCLHGHHCTLDVCVTTIHWQRTIFIGLSNGRLRKQPMAMWHLITSHWLLYISIERKRERFCPLERTMPIHSISNHLYYDSFFEKHPVMHLALPYPVQAIYTMLGKCLLTPCFTFAVIKSGVFRPW